MVVEVVEVVVAVRDFTSPLFLFLLLLLLLSFLLVVLSTPPLRASPLTFARLDCDGLMDCCLGLRNEKCGMLRCWFIDVSKEEEEEEEEEEEKEGKGREFATCTYSPTTLRTACGMKQ